MNHFVVDFLQRMIEHLLKYGNHVLSTTSKSFQRWLLKHVDSATVLFFSFYYFMTACSFFQLSINSRYLFQSFTHFVPCFVHCKKIRTSTQLKSLHRSDELVDSQSCLKQVKNILLENQLTFYSILQTPGK